jgi:RNA polymerase sigma-54 factor
MNSPSLRVNLEHKQQQTMSPRLQHAVRLLQMSSLEFAQKVHEALGTNPFLELDEGDGEGGASPEVRAEGLETVGLEPPGTGVAASGELPTLPVTDSLSDLQAPDGAAGTMDSAYDAESSGDGDREFWQSDTGSPGARQAPDGEGSVMDRMAVEDSLAHYLASQINVLPLPERDRVLAHAIIESLDDDGYLREPLAELAAVLDLEPAVSVEELQIALTRVQALDPAGIGARNVGECLQLQLPTIEDAGERAIAAAIVGEHLQALAAKDVAGMAKALGRTPAEIERVCERIRRLDPRPGWRFDSTQTQYVVPDVMVKKVRGCWTVQLNPAIVPRVRLNNFYATLFRQHRCANDSELAQHLQEARWTLRNVEQRFATILSVAHAVIKRQKHFLEFGPMAMKPLGLKEIAEECGMHESTVSRVTNNKYVATPLGVFELKHFFSRAMTTASGSDVSGTAIRGLIKDMIEGEDPRNPLSDVEIARLLSRQGLMVARRTVTKYRQLLKIEAVERRRRHAVVS